MKLAATLGCRHRYLAAEDAVPVDEAGPDREHDSRGHDRAVVVGNVRHLGTHRRGRHEDDECTLRPVANLLAMASWCFWWHFSYACSRRQATLQGRYPPERIGVLVRRVRTSRTTSGSRKNSIRCEKSPQHGNQRFQGLLAAVTNVLTNLLCRHQATLPKRVKQIFWTVESRSLR